MDAKCVSQLLILLRVGGFTKNFDCFKARLMANFTYTDLKRHQNDDTTIGNLGEVK